MSKEWSIVGRASTLELAFSSPALSLQGSNVMCIMLSTMPLVAPDPAEQGLP